MFIVDFQLEQRVSEPRGIVLWIGQRARNVPNVDDELDFLRSQQVDELVDGTSRMSDCKKSMRHGTDLLLDLRYFFNFQTQFVAASSSLQEPRGSALYRARSNR